MIKSPRCEICYNIEFRNRVNFGYIIGKQVHRERVKMCKNCETSRVKKVAEDEFGNPIYVKKEG